MSAREELFEALMPVYRTQWARGEEDSTNDLLDAYRDQILAEAADKIYGNIGRDDYPGETQRVKDIVSVARSMAKLIDPREQS